MPSPSTDATLRPFAAAPHGRVLGRVRRSDMPALLRLPLWQRREAPAAHATAAHAPTLQEPPVH